jgi:hypothetical protein
MIPTCSGQLGCCTSHAGVLSPAWQCRWLDEWPLILPLLHPILWRCPPPYQPLGMLVPAGGVFLGAGAVSHLVQLHIGSDASRVLQQRGQASRPFVLHRPELGAFPLGRR